MNAELRDYFTVSQVARRLKLSDNRIRKLIATGELAAVRTPLGSLIEPGVLERFATAYEERKRTRLRRSEERQNASRH